MLCWFNPAPIFVFNICSHKLWWHRVAISSGTSTRILPSGSQWASHPLRLWLCLRLCLCLCFCLCICLSTSCLPWFSYLHAALHLPTLKIGGSPGGHLANTLFCTIKFEMSEKSISVWSSREGKTPVKVEILHLVKRFFRNTPARFHQNIVWQIWMQNCKYLHFGKKGW